MNGIAGMGGAAPDHTHHHHPIHMHHSHRHRRSGSHTSGDAGPSDIDGVPDTPADITIPVPDTSGNLLSVSGRTSTDAPPSFTEATSNAAIGATASDTASVRSHAAPAAVTSSPGVRPVLDGRVVLRIGEKQFFTTRATVAESALLTTLLSTDATHDGEYFLDADPDMFTQILRFLRTRRFPLFYDQTHGYDAERYLELLVAAQFYHIPTLEMWLSEKRYLGAVNIKSEYRAYSLYGTDQIVRMHELCWGRDEQARVLTMSEKKSKVWACPMKMWRHDGDQNKCLKAKCYAQALPRTSPPGLALMRVLSLTALITKTEIRESVLSAGAYPEGPPPYQGGGDD